MMAMRSVLFVSSVTTIQRFKTLVGMPAVPGLCVNLVWTNMSKSGYRLQFVVRTACTTWVKAVVRQGRGERSSLVKRWIW